jgi:hypothetical protein
VQGTWTAPITSRLLLDAGASWQTANWVNFAEKGVTRDDRSILETATNYRYGATTLLTAPKARTGRSAERFSVSYVTGTHNMKVGVTNEQAFNDESRDRNNQVDGLNYDFLNAKPIRLQYYALPFFVQTRQHMELGVFAQDAWKVKRFTLNLGLRWDRINNGFPAGQLPAGLFVPARTATSLSGIPLWNDINPRVGTAIDLFGTGRTALKAAFGRYNQLSRSDFTGRFHPFNSSINSAFRTWTDSNNNYIPDCDVQNLAAQDLSASGGDICGPISNVNFGKFNPQAVIFDNSAVLHNRDYLWDVNLDLQHEIIHGLSVDVGYNHNWDGSFTVTENTLTDPTSYDEFCITMPNDPRLPNAGQRQCGYYDINPQFFGKGTLRVTNAKEFVGKNGNTKLPQRYWDGVWVSASGRLPRNISIGGGVDVGRQVDDHCFTVDVPNQPYDVNGTSALTTWANNLDFRLNGSIPIKGGFNGSFIFRNTPGATENATLTVTAANITFTNGRAANTLTNPQVINLLTPNSLFGARFNQLDLSVNRTMNVGWGKVRLAFDLYNALNANSIQNVTTTYGTTWLRPTTFLDPRLARVTVALQF